MARQQVIVNALLVLLGFAVSGGFKHIFYNKNDGKMNIPEAAAIIGDTNISVAAPVEEVVVKESPKVEQPPHHVVLEDQKVQFVFYMGLVGSGHDYLNKIAMASPALKHMTDLNAFPMDAHKLQSALLHEEAGLWSAYFSSTPAELLNLTDTQARLVKTLHRINIKLGKGPDERYYVPVNILSTPYGEYGPVRYLNDRKKGKVRMISYPSIDLLYDACEEAQVDCRHVYLHRDPYELLHKSTAKHVLEAMHTATSMLLVIASQMRMYPERTLGCWNLWTQNRTDVGGLQSVFGWKEGEQTREYEQVLATNHVPLNVSANQVHSIVPAMNQNYFDSMSKTHRMVLGVCRDNAVLR
jgi:hypothetical protein